VGTPKPPARLGPFSWSPCRLGESCGMSPNEVGVKFPIAPSDGLKSSPGADCARIELRSVDTGGVHVGSSRLAAGRFPSISERYLEKSIGAGDWRLKKLGSSANW